MRKTGWFKVGTACVLLVAGCSGSDQKATETRTAADPPKISGDDKSRCDAKGKDVVKLDLNQDQVPDVWKLYESRTESGAKVQSLACKEMDLNFDGRKDMWIYYDRTGARKMEEMDLDFDGKIDLVTVRQGGKVVRQELDTDFDGKADIWKYFEGSSVARVDRDSNHDGKIDYWEYYEGGQLDRIGYDKDGDGKVDVWDRAPATPTAALPPAESGTSGEPAAPPAESAEAK